MENDAIKVILEGLKPPEDLFAQMARQKDGFSEVWLGVRKVSRADLDCEGWYKDLRPTGEEPPAMLWCSDCEQRVVVAWRKQNDSAKPRIRQRIRPWTKAAYSKSCTGFRGPVEAGSAR